jgi:predicted PurR-regulated permease PerM
MIKLDILFSLLVVLIFVLFFYKQISKIINKDYNIPYIDLDEHITTISELKENLHNVEQMITDVQICTPNERATAFKLYMHTNHTSVDILADNSSQNILVLLEDERRKLRSALYHEVKKLSYRCNFDSNANDNFFNKIQ